MWTRTSMSLSCCVFYERTKHTIILRPLRISKKSKQKATKKSSQKRMKTVPYVRSHIVRERWQRRQTLPYTMGSRWYTPESETNRRDKYAALLNVVNVAFIVCQINWEIVVGACMTPPRTRPTELAQTDVYVNRHGTRTYIWNATHFAWASEIWSFRFAEYPSTKSSEHSKQSQIFYANEF